MSRPAQRHAAPKMTREQNRNAAFMAVTMGDPDRIDAAMISRTTGVSIAEIERMIAEKRGRDAAT